MSTTTPAQAVDGSTVPAYLRTLHRWIVWGFRPDNNGKPQKVPLSLTGHNVSAYEPRNWLGYEAASTAFQNDLIGHTDHDFEGVGIVLGDCGNGTFLGGADFDLCLDAGVLQEWASPLLASIDGRYAEISPSMTGLKTLFAIDSATVAALREEGRLGNTGNARIAKLPASAEPGAAHKSPGVEVYVDKRWFAVTGQRHAGALPDVRMMPLDAAHKLLAAMDAIAPPKPASTASKSARPWTGAQPTEVESAQLDGKIAVLLKVNPNLATRWEGTVANLGDPSGSGLAMAVGSALKAMGFNSGEMCEALRRCPATEAWTDKSDERQLRRVWENAAARGVAEDYADIDPATIAQPASLQMPTMPTLELHAPIDPWEPLTPPPSTFPLTALPPVLRAFVQDRARMLGADPAAIAWAALGACSAAIDGSIRLHMKQHDKWRVPPALWVALVGASSTKKTPIIDATWGPLRRKQSVKQAEHAGLMALWKSKVEDDKRNPGQQPGPPEMPPLPPPRYVSDDATVEALQILLAQQDRGIGLVADELAGLIGGFGRYSAGKSGGATERARYLQGYNGHGYTPDRVSRTALAIKNWLFAIIGGIQPDRLRDFHDISDDGLWPRFLAIIVGPGTDDLDEPSGGAVDAYTRLIENLTTYPGGARVHLSPAARAVRERIAADLGKLEKGEPLGAAFATFCGKLHGVWGRLALILHYGSGEAAGDVSEATAEAARELIMDSVLPNAARVYASMSRGDGADVEATRAIAGWILAKRKLRVLSSDLMSDVRCCRGKPLPIIQKMLQTLEGGGWLTPSDSRNPRAWTVDPRVHEIFTERAVEETVLRNAVRHLLAGQVKREATPDAPNAEDAK